MLAHFQTGALWEQEEAALIADERTTDTPFFLRAAYHFLPPAPPVAARRVRTNRHRHPGRARTPDLPIRFEAGFRVGRDFPEVRGRRERK